VVASFMYVILCIRTIRTDDGLGSSELGIIETAVCIYSNKGLGRRSDEDEMMVLIVIVSFE
jgi:hypothetical protein